MRKISSQRAQNFNGHVKGLVLAWEFEYFVPLMCLGFTLFLLEQSLSILATLQLWVEDRRREIRFAKTEKNRPGPRGDLNKKCNKFVSGPDFSLLFCSVVLVTSFTHLLQLLFGTNIEN